MAAHYDVVVVGGSAAGLSGALVLGRARWRVLLCDTHQPRNAVAPAAHGFFTRDGTPPDEILSIGRAQLQPYGVEQRSVAVTAMEGSAPDFVVTLATGEQVHTRRLLLATGMRDTLPPIEGIETFWGTSVILCPFCHGWEVRDQPIAAMTIGKMDLYRAYFLRQWSRDLVLCTNGAEPLTAEERDQLAAEGIPLYEQPILRLEGSGRQLEGLRFADGTFLARRAFFAHPTQGQHSGLAQELGCAMGEDGLVSVDEEGQTSVLGVYAAGDMTTQRPQIVAAAATGARAAAAITLAFIQERMNERIALPASARPLAPDPAAHA